MHWLLWLTATPTALIMFLRIIALVLPKGPAQVVSYYAFSIASVILLLSCSLYGVFASIVLRCLAHGGMSQWTTGRAYKWTMWLATGVTFRITGSMKREGGVSGEEALGMRPVVFVGNHQTELDVLMLGCMFPKWCSVTAKKSLKWTPFLGWFMALSKTVFIDRANRTQARTTFDNAVVTMRKERQSVFIFPEGTRSYASEPMLLPFKKGAFHLAIDAQVPIVPVVCANYSNVFDTKKKRVAPGIVDVSVLPPIPTKGLGKEDVDDLVEKTRKVMLDELIRLSHVTGQGNGAPLPAAPGVDAGTRELRKRY
ncbi:1-acylglycerol-3-phosphate O-acyltransferase [Setomelanomma holmii]|uniref:1-acyl-sn-glycerol-3-phosphate acyltransferase n=1 Tax=Setomelanomma holmii TaxID=210430 RepID=A0A9P4H3V9_9PLEO|nr:1-acylglycerol-3-phosphate O-acyltransferase [Setomelanomma holmii]